MNIFSFSNNLFKQPILILVVLIFGIQGSAQVLDTIYTGHTPPTTITKKVLRYKQQFVLIKPGEIIRDYDSEESEGEYNVYRKYNEKDLRVITYYHHDESDNENLNSKTKSALLRQKKMEVNFYGLENTSDKKKFLQEKYSAIVWFNDSIYMTKKWLKRGLFFSKQNIEISPVWDVSMFDAQNKMIILKNADSSCLFDFDGRQLVKPIKGSIEMDPFGAIINTKGETLYLDTNYQRFSFKGSNKVSDFRYGIGIETSSTDNSMRYINLQGKYITKPYAHLKPFFLSFSFAMDSTNRFAIINQDGTLGSGFKFDQFLSYTDDGILEILGPNQFDYFDHYQRSYNHNQEHIIAVYIRPKRLCYPIIAHSEEGYYFYDSTGKLLSPTAYTFLNYINFQQHKLAVLGKFDLKYRDIVYTVVDENIKEISSVRYLMIKINFIDNKTIVESENTNREIKRRSFDEWLRELNIK